MRTPTRGDSNALRDPGQNSGDPRHDSRDPGKDPGDLRQDPSDPSLRPATTILADAHVHFHPCYRLEPFLDGAVTNFQRAARDLVLPNSRPLGCLLLTEAAGDSFYRSISAFVTGNADADRSSTAGEQPRSEKAPGAQPRGEKAPGGRWSFHATGEEIALRAERTDGAVVLLIAGRQVAAREGLEVLALGTLREFPDGRELRESIREVFASGALAVLPWGFGKWWLRRRALLEEILDVVPPGSLFLGDNSGRPGFTGRPVIFREAEARGFRVLPGSDPLPFSHEEGRAGALGLAFELPAFDPERPARAILGALRSSATELVPFGSLESPLRFLRHQFGMQIRKRGRAS